MKKIIFLFFIFFSCGKKDKNNFKQIISEYIQDYPCNMENYNYTIRFYEKNKDTLFEINQDFETIEYPISSFFDTTNNQKFEYIGSTYISGKRVKIFDTNKKIGKKLYSDFKIIKDSIKHGIFTRFSYPIIPITKTYKVVNNDICFFYQRNTLRFK